eukprot:136082-Pyramimonas_sp.AAC.1
MMRELRGHANAKGKRDWEGIELESAHWAFGLSSIERACLQKYETLWEQEKGRPAMDDPAAIFSTSQNPEKVFLRLLLRLR